MDVTFRVGISLDLAQFPDRCVARITFANLRTRQNLDVFWKGLWEGRRW